MLKNSNKYTFIFSSVMVIVVAILLSVAAISLAPLQEKNLKVEKMQNILSSVGISSTAKEAEKIFKLNITDQVVLNNKGQIVEGTVPAFNIDIKKEMDKEKTGEAGKELYPLFICNIDSQTFYIVPVRGKGLWGPIWGYISLEQDMNTVHGVSFGHKSETPGLGAEIDKPAFQEQFVGKKIIDEQGKFVSVKVVKGGVPAGNLHGVDAVSGATITSDGVEEMLYRTLNHYMPYFRSAQDSASNTTVVNLK